MHHYGARYCPIMTDWVLANMNVNLRDWILEAANGEPIEGVVIGEMGWGDYGKDNVPNYDTHPRNRVIPWTEAEKYLTYKFSSGYGAPGCEAITAWTPSRVIAICQYDGSTSPFWLPRHPVDHKPTMPGG